MIRCKHDLADRETACADGMCPMCLAAEVERLQGENDPYAGVDVAGLRASVPEEFLTSEARLARLVKGLEDTLEHHNRAGRVKASAIQALIKEARDE